MKKIMATAFVAAAVLAACGSDDDPTEQALSSVCDSQTQVLESVGALVTADGETTTGDDLNGLAEDLQSSVDQLDEAQGELAEQDIENVQSAFEDLKGELSDLGDVPLAELDAEVATTIGEAITAFQAAYTDAYANSSCSADAADDGSETTEE